MRVAVIRGNTVENVIEAASVETAQALFLDATCLEAGEAGPGWAWHEGTGFVPPAPPIPPVPASVTNFQARAVLMQMPGGTEGRTLFQDVDDALRAQNGVAWQAWEYANDITRDGVLVGQMAAQFGLSEAQLDDLFRQAAAISA